MLLFWKFLRLSLNICSFRILVSSSLMWSIELFGVRCVLMSYLILLKLDRNILLQLPFSQRDSAIIRIRRTWLDFLLSLWIQCLLGPRGFNFFMYSLRMKTKSFLFRSSSINCRGFSNVIALWYFIFLIIGRNWWIIDRVIIFYYIFYLRLKYILFFIFSFIYLTVFKQITFLKITRLFNTKIIW